MRYLGLRLASGVAVVFGAVTLTFLLLHLAPGDPVERLLGPAVPEAQLAAQRHALGLDRPLATQYAAWIGHALQNEWGTSIATGRPVRSVIARAWPFTAVLVVLSLVLSYGIGIAVGALQALRGRSRLDTTLSVITVGLTAVPGYWLGLMLVMVFTYELRWLPAFGAVGFDADFLPAWGRVVDAMRHLALPLLTLTLIGTGGAARFARGAMLDVREAPFVQAAFAKGLTPGRVARRHLLRNAAIPLITLLGLSLPAVFSGTVFVEAVFAWPGVGRVLVEAVQARDYPVVMAAATISAVLVVTGNLFADALLAIADPRLRTDQATVPGPA